MTRGALRRFGSGVALCATLAGAPAASAHETWLTPHGVAGGRRVFGLTSGEAYPRVGTGPKASRVQRLVATRGGAPVQLSVGAEGASELAVSAAEAPGLLVLEISLGPHPIELAPGKVTEYFAEAHPSAAVRRAWAAQPAPPVWRETYVKNAKALLCTGDCAHDRTALRPTGAPLEFVPLSPGPRPRALRLLAGGRPLAGQTVELFDARGLRARRLTDASGALRLDLPLRGRAMASTVWLRPPPTPQGRFESDFASLTFDVR